MALPAGALASDAPGNQSERSYARDIPPFLPPALRERPSAEAPWPHNQYLVLCYHDVDDLEADQNYVAVRTSALFEQFAWLRENGYRPVSVDDILRAQAGGPALPPRAILLTFDDGFSSFYHRVLPALKAFNWPAVLAPVGKWMDTPANRPVDFAGLPTERRKFANWQMIRDIHRSGLVEIGAHTYDMHYGSLANPQGNMMPTAAFRLYDPKRKAYETDDQYRKRFSADVKRISERIRQATGKAPRVWVWPYGASSGLGIEVLKQHGYLMAYTLNDGLATLDQPMSVPRFLITDNPSLDTFRNAMGFQRDPPRFRVMNIDLDLLYDPDPDRQAKNLDALIKRVFDMRVTTVFISPFARPGPDGRVREAYFPNRVLPVRTDIFSRVAWQLRTRANAEVFALMPVLAYDLGPGIETVQSAGAVHPVRRVSPFSAEGRRRILSIYEDLGRHVPIHGVVFGGDALLTRTEDTGPAALAAYRAAGLPATAAEIAAMDDATALRLARFKTGALVRFTRELAEGVRRYRNPDIRMTRMIAPDPVLDPAREVDFAQNYDEFLRAYDQVVPLAMPYTQGVRPDDVNSWIDRLVSAARTRSDGVRRAIFLLQSRDWNRPPGQDALDARELVGWMRRLMRNGAVSFGYYPDDFLANQPEMTVVRSELADAWFPLPPPRPQEEALPPATLAGGLVGGTARVLPGGAATGAALATEPTLTRQPASAPVGTRAPAPAAGGQRTPAYQGAEPGAKPGAKPDPAPGTKPGVKSNAKSDVAPAVKPGTGGPGPVPLVPAGDGRLRDEAVSGRHRGTLPPTEPEPRQDATGVADDFDLYPNAGPGQRDPVPSPGETR